MRVVKVGDTEVTREEELYLISADGSERVKLNSGDMLQVVEPPSSELDGRIKWNLMDTNGFAGFVTAEPDDLLPESATEEDETVSEVVIIGDVEREGEHTTLALKGSLQNVYDRTTAALNANVARATHGETVEEVLGSGDATQPHQRFVLKQSPRAHVSVPTSSGTESTLRLRVNDLLWHEVPTLYRRGPQERVFVTRTSDDGQTTIQFGDGRAGVRLPTGSANMRAEYRKGIGLEGNLTAGQLSQLLDRPLGVKGVTGQVVEVNLSVYCITERKPVFPGILGGGPIFMGCVEHK